MNKTTTYIKMENNTGVDFYSLSLTFLFYILGIIVDFKETVIILVGLSTLLYNSFKFYNEFVKKKKGNKN